jgi:hypothetical protein
MRPTQTSSLMPQELTREQAQTKLKAAGLLSSLSYLSEDIRPLSDSERARLGALLANARPSGEILDDDRGAH